jgi:ribonucleoside-diphosphate reductase alpha chain
MNIDKDTQREALASFNFSQSYARYNTENKRRETWEEAVERVMNMHGVHLAQLEASAPEGALESIERAYKAKRILGSQRSLQFGGEAVLAKHPRAYNCTTAYVDTPKRFGEALYLLLCGAGVGYSVQSHHVGQLPPVRSLEELEAASRVPFVIEDSIEGWARALDALVDAYLGQGDLPAFDGSLVRPKGSVIRSCGGKAPGPEPLLNMLREAENLLLSRAGQSLRPIDASDLMCISADCVRAGGVRRAALIALFDLTDDEMLTSKSAGNWWETHPWRARANISALALRHRAKEPEYAAAVRRVFEFTKSYGEPGIIWVNSLETAYNPCVEVGMVPMLIKDEKGQVLTEYALDYMDFDQRDKWRARGLTYETGWQFCNLTEVNAAAFKDPQDAFEAVRLATHLGLIQAGYTLTDDDYLVAGGRTCTREILEREYLLGVSLTGLGSAPAWVREERFLEELGLVAGNTARMYWEAYALKRCPARVTCVKPSGNAAVLLGCASGVHADHAPRYLRRVQASGDSAITQAYMDANPKAAERSVWSRNGNDYVLSFAIEAPAHALLKTEQTAQEFLEWVALVQRSWVREGTVRLTSAGPVRHNVSNTCVVHPHEWEGVIETLATRPYEFGGVSCLGASGDYDYPQAPFCRVYEPHEVSEDDPHRDAKLAAWELWNELRASHVPVDYSLVHEAEDNTEVMGEVACAGGACELKL